MINQKTLSTCITASANFATNYNFQSIAIVLLIMSTEECTSNDENCKLGDQQPWVESSTSAAIFLGAVCGQISMGYVGDLMTRSQALLITLIVACFGSVMCAVAPAGEPTSIYAVLVVFRFVTGYGLGGIYPLSASKSAEDGGGGVAGKINSVASSWAFFWQMPGTHRSGPRIVVFV